VLTRRLLDYAGLGELGARVTLFTDDADVETHVPRGPHTEVAAWFAGIEDGVCLFGARKDLLADDDAIVGSMCHEVAHAFRHHHGFEKPSDEQAMRLEEQKTDLTTIYLGFGILTVNRTYQYKKSGYLAGGRVYTKHTESGAGYLSPQDMAFALAAQLIARRAEGRERRRVAK
jgi:hypothetical protein